jgi:hypothetical protein
MPPPRATDSDKAETCARFALTRPNEEDGSPGASSSAARIRRAERKRLDNCHGLNMEAKWFTDNT